VRAVFLTLALWLVASPAVAAPPEIPTELTDYVSKPDKSFLWKMAGEPVKTDFGTVSTIDMVSQTWQGIDWDHKIQIFVPPNVKPQATLVLWNEGGSPSIQSTILGFKVAEKLKAPFAILFGVPKQPLYGGKTEDALIAESFVRYLVTEDPSWPLLFPMVKSVVRGMDALQAFAKKEWLIDVTGFVITGASKRGWTAWLTAATGDKRVKAIAPLVFDSLNIAVQMDNQVKAFTKPSDMIKDYGERLLIPIPKTAAAQRLWKIIDPWTYRERITCPKLIVNGTNDEYWPLDALNSYWDDLKGDKWVLYVPNAGHMLCESDKNGKMQPLPERTMATVAAFCRCQIFGKTMPMVDSTLICPIGGDCLDITVTASLKPTAARIFSTDAESRDFRKSFWEPKPLAWGSDKTTCKIESPKAGHQAAFVELGFEQDGMSYTLSTPLRILPAPKKK